MYLLNSIHTAIINNISGHSQRSSKKIHNRGGGGGKTAGRIDQLLWGISCGWRMLHLRWLAKCVNATMPSEVRCQNARCALSLSRVLVVGDIGNNVMRMQHAWYRDFNVLRSRAHFFVIESAAISDHRHACHNFQFPNLLKTSCS